MITIPEFENYTIDEYGKVFSKYTNKFLTQRMRNGYPFVTLFSDEFPKGKNLRINRLVARCFLNMKTLYNKLEIDHKDRDVMNNHYLNLQVLTKQEHIEKTLLDKGFKKDIAFCPVCNKKIRRNAKYCIDHLPQKADYINRCDIETEVKKLGWSKASKIFDVSDNGLRKIYKKLGGNPSELKRIICV